MKKICLLLIVFLISVSCFAGCSNQSDTNEQESTEAVSSDVQNTADNTSEKAASSQSLVTTAAAKKPIEDAKLSSAEASEKIQSFSLEKLGLKGKKEDYKFMVSTKGTTIDKTDYFEVVASVVTEKNKDGSINMETKGQYFVSYDGTKLLSRDLKTGEFSELK